MNYMEDDMTDAYGDTSGGTGTKGGLSDQASESLKQIQKETSKVACECNHGLLVETLKKYMFAQNKAK